MDTSECGRRKDEDDDEQNSCIKNKDFKSTKYTIELIPNVVAVQEKVTQKNSDVSNESESESSKDIGASAQSRVYYSQKTVHSDEIQNKSKELAIKGALQRQIATKEDSICDKSRNPESGITANSVGEAKRSNGQNRSSAPPASGSRERGKSGLSQSRSLPSHTTVHEEEVPVIVRRRGCTLRVRITSYADSEADRLIYVGISQIYSPCFHTNQHQSQALCCMMYTFIGVLVVWWAIFEGDFLSVYSLNRLWLMVNKSCFPCNESYCSIFTNYLWSSCWKLLFTRTIRLTNNKSMGLWLSHWY